MRINKINEMKNNEDYFEISERNKKYFFKVIKEIYNIEDNEEYEDIEWRIDFNSTFDFLVVNQYKDKTFFKIMLGHKGEWDEEEIHYISLYKKRERPVGYCKCIKCDSKQQKLRPINKDMHGWERDYHKCCFFDYIKYSCCNENDLKKYEYRDLNIH